MSTSTAIREELQEIAPVYRDNQMTVDGKIYGFPDDGDVFVMYYRTDVLGDPKIQEAYKAKYGADLPVPPKTWKEFDQVGATDHRGHRRQALRRRLLPRLGLRPVPVPGALPQQWRQVLRPRDDEGHDQRPGRRQGVHRLAGREQVDAARRRDLGLRREPRRLPAGRHRDDRLLAALWPLGRRLRHRRGGAVLGAEEPGRRQGRLRHAAGRPSAAGGGLRAQHRRELQEQGRRLPVHPVAEQPGHQPASGCSCPTRCATRSATATSPARSTRAAGRRRRNIWRRCRPVRSTGCSTSR